jgi:hypothetical protein
LLSHVPSYPLSKDTLTQFLAYRNDRILKGELNLKGAAQLMVYVTKAAKVSSYLVCTSMAAGIIASFSGRNVFPAGALVYQRVRENCFVNL